MIQDQSNHLHHRANEWETRAVTKSRVRVARYAVHHQCLTWGIVVALMLGLLSVMRPAAVSAAEQTAVFQVSITIPVRGIPALGSLTLVYDDASGIGTWAFDGTIDGQPASASGSMTIGQSAGSQRIELTEIAVDEWTLPLNRPEIVFSIGMRFDDGAAFMTYRGPGADLFSIPFELAPTPVVPISGAFILADVGSTDAPVDELPSTGQRATLFADVPWQAVVLAISGALMVCVAAGTAWKRRSMRLRR